MNWITHSSAAFATRFAPIHSPSGTPSTVAATNPPSNRSSVDAALPHSVVPR